MKPGVVVPGVLLGLLAVVGVGYVVREWDEARAEERRRADAQALCERWADQLHQQTTESGSYVRWEGETLPDADPWGNPLQVAYSQGGVAESVEVRSLGRDGVSHTADDVVAARRVVNFKEVGHGIKAGAEEAARNVA